ncbi:hypothetical protein [Endozoicomonas sp. SCSIO W0465]|uniref:hypothetical protein n=1 Tax=Endozoicomonas sp. SCSIO W0465 TaxID=2918516 RepID=UPI0020757196|nr:hypothetical protein [Endozoicomonas sp. SCSIO W0465]USE39524.1 hypothetical protein MJO57_15980 [Endozoicomonas sp. SCSIO W0465]
MKNAAKGFNPVLLDTELKSDSNIIFSSQNNHNVNLYDYFEPYRNPLLGLHNSTWTAKLYMMSASGFRQFQRDPKQDVPEVVIAESGVTSSFEIKNIEIKSVAPGTPRTKNSSVQLVDIEIYEPYGRTLLDRLDNAAFSLGIQTLSKIPLLLDIGYKGYDPITNKPVDLGAYGRTYRIQVQNIDIDPEGGAGTTYTFKCTFMNFLHDPDTWFLGEQVEFTSKNTVQDFANELESVINSIDEAQFKDRVQTGNGEVQPESYRKIIVQPSIGNLKVQSKKGTSNTTWSFAPDFSIGKIFDLVMDQVISDDGVYKRQFIQVVPVYDYAGYDPVRKTPIYLITYYVIQYSTADSTSLQQLNIPESNSLSALRTIQNAALKSTDGRLGIKSYEYTFTGLNNEILDLSANYNDLYSYVSERNIESRLDKNNRDGFYVSDAQPADPVLVTSNGNPKNLYNYNPSSIDTVNSSTQNIRDFSSFQRNTSSIQIPISYGETETAIGTKNNNDSLASAIKRVERSNYYNGLHLQTISLSVVGDPYWLIGSEEEFKGELIDIINERKRSLVDGTTLQMDSLRHEPYFLLRFIDSAVPDTETGLAYPTGQEVQNLFRVETVVHTFDEDGFTQDITGVLITRTL